MVEKFFQVSGGTKKWSWTTRKAGEGLWERDGRIRVCTKSWSSLALEVGWEDGRLRTNSVLNRMILPNLLPKPQEGRKIPRICCIPKTKGWIHI